MAKEGARHDGRVDGMRDVVVIDGRGGGRGGTVGDGRDVGWRCGLVWWWRKRGGGEVWVL